MQFSLSSALPSHDFPPCLGSGFTHSLPRQRSHSELHTDQRDHPDQPPSTTHIHTPNTFFASPCSIPHHLHSDDLIESIHTYKYSDSSPGQGKEQLLFCVEIPSQNAPPFSGAGLVHVRVRFIKPRPQCTLQSDQSDHDDHPPFTNKWRKNGEIDKRDYDSIGKIHNYILYTVKEQWDTDFVLMKKMEQNVKYWGFNY